MPSESEDQRKAAAIAYAVKTKQLPKSKLKGASLQMYKSMTVKELRDFASKRRED